jgi:hypothetical protein
MKKWFAVVSVVCNLILVAILLWMSAERDNELREALSGVVPGKATIRQDDAEPGVHKNVIYGMHGGLALLMDVYEPTEPNGHALLFIAGSGWHWPTDYGAGGIKDAVASGILGGGSVDVFADAGFMVFVINHRQAPL